MSYDPWQSLGVHHPTVHLELYDIHPARAAWLPGHSVLFIDPSLSRIEGRCALAHEIAHIDLGHVPTGIGRWDARQERDADRLAASRLVEIGDLAEAYAASSDDYHLAEALFVEVPVIHTRFRTLHRIERLLLKARVARIEQVA